MAANDYYNNFDSSTSKPSLDTQNTQPSKYSSPFDDPSYSEYGRVSRPLYQDSAYDSPHYDPGSHRPEPTDPFADKNAIPMQSHIPSAGQFVPGSSGSGDRTHGRVDSGAISPLESGGDSKRRWGRGRKKSRFFSGPVPWAVYFLTTVQIIVFISEIIRNAVLTGSPIGIRPQFNPMIGPSPYVLINMGARYNPCMHRISEIRPCDQSNSSKSSPSTGISWPCPNSTTTEALCSLSELCGFGGVPNPTAGGTPSDGPQPNQWFRFIIPIFLHAGLIHIGFNMLIQVSLARQMEKVIGTVRFIIVYFSSGIFGFVLGGNYAAQGIASTGASGSLFGILALILLDLLYSWRERRSPIKDLLFILLDVAIAFALGLLPGLDNFSHIGGFIMGLVLGICILHSPNPLRRRIGEDESPYVSVAGTGINASRGDKPSGLMLLIREPVGFFKGRKPLWWAWWLLRAGALVGVLAGFIVLLNNFYVHQRTCGWCKYLSCIDINNWCAIGNLCFTGTTNSTSQTSKRDLFGVSDPMFMAPAF